MYSQNSIDKNCVGPDVCSGRFNPSRFPVSIPKLGDENQQIRIQLAVHKYNNSTNNPISIRCSGSGTPARNSFLKNSLKAKSYEGDDEGTSRVQNRNGYKYEGVGAFPTIHLKKSAVRYRPIRRFNDVKIPHPELPVNRFLSQLPQVCSDIKSSTRSVLDVLEDLSGKKISSDDKSKSKGLGGDCVLNHSSMYKPLFVPKPIGNSVLTRDNTTQTISSNGADAPSCAPITNQLSKKIANDPKAELRRKLAKQNNEIFASLSSSMLSFALKRKIDKVVPNKDSDNSSEGSTSKKSRLSESFTINHSSNGYPKSRLKTNTNDSVKPNLKTKRMEANSPTSPNKDRLTTIFLDTRNTSPKAQMFQKSPVPAETNSKSKGESATSSQISSPTPEIQVADTAKPPSEPPKPTFGLPTSTTATSETAKTTLPTFQFNAPTSTAANSFSFPTPVTSSAASDKSTNEKATTNSNDGKTETNPTNPANFGSFKFGAENVGATVSTESKTPTSTPATVSATSTPIPQFSFGVPSNTANTAASPTSGFSIGGGLSSTPAKPTFTFGQTPLVSQPSAKTPEKPTVIGQNPLIGENKDKSAVQNMTSSGSTAVSTAVSFSSNGTTLVNSSTFAPVNKSLFTFGQKTENTNSSKETVEQGKKLSFGFEDKSGTPENKTAQGFGLSTSKLFTFGQTSSAQQTTPSSVAPTQTVTSPNQPPAASQPTSMFNQSISTLGPASQVKFGQTPTSQTTTEAKTETTTTVSQNTFTLPAVKAPLFGTSSNSSGFGTTTTTQATTGFGTVTTASGFGFTIPSSTQSTSSFGVSAPQPTLTFGVSSSSQGVNGFSGNSVSAPSSGFGTSVSSSVSSFGTSTATPAFGLSASSSAPTPTFLATSNSQAIPAFGSTTAPTMSFGATSTTQSISGFGTSTSQSAPTFGLSSTTAPTSTFGVSSGFGVPPSSQPNTVFGTATSRNGFGATNTFSATPSTQTDSAFGSGTSVTGFGTSQASFNQPFGNKPTTSIGQTTNIFGTNMTPSFSSGTGFGAGQTNVFGQKPNLEGNIFDQNKVQPPAFGTTSQPFGTQNKFSFGTSTSNAPAFTSSQPNTTASIFNFGSAAPASNTFAFGSSSSTPANNSFGFKSSNEPFTFGATTTKEGTGFGGSNPSTFTFGGQMNNNGMAEQKPSFNFGGAQPSSAPFSFGATPSPSVFNFGSSSAGSGSSGFAFGTPPTGSPFGQPSTSSPAAPFPVPGTFSIGSGSSQSRPRATSRPRRRP